MGPCGGAVRLVGLVAKSVVLRIFVMSVSLECTGMVRRDPICEYASLGEEGGLLRIWTAVVCHA